MQEGNIMIEYVRMTNNVADILMKPLKGGETTQLAQAMGLVIPVRGGVEVAPERQPCKRAKPPTGQGLCMHNKFGGNQSAHV